MIYQVVGNVLFLSLLEGLRGLAGPLPGTHPGIWTCLLKHSIYLDHIGRVCSSTNRIHSLPRSLSTFSQRLMMSRRSQLGSHAPHTGNLWKGEMFSKMKLWVMFPYSYSVTYVPISQRHAVEVFQPLRVSGNLTSE